MQKKELEIGTLVYMKPYVSHSYLLDPEELEEEGLASTEIFIHEKYPGRIENPEELLIRLHWAKIHAGKGDVWLKVSFEEDGRIEGTALVKKFERWRLEYGLQDLFIVQSVDELFNKLPSALSQVNQNPVEIALGRIGKSLSEHIRYGYQDLMDALVEDGCWDWRQGKYPIENYLWIRMGDYGYIVRGVVSFESIVLHNLKVFMDDREIEGLSTKTKSEERVRRLLHKVIDFAKLIRSGDFSSLKVYEPLTVDRVKHLIQRRADMLKTREKIIKILESKDDILSIAEEDLNKEVLAIRIGGRTLAHYMAVFGYPFSPEKHKDILCLADENGKTVAHEMVIEKYIFDPERHRDVLKLLDENDVSVAHLMVKYNLFLFDPEKHRDILELGDALNRTVAHEMAARGFIFDPAKHGDICELTDDRGRTVIDTFITEYLPGLEEESLQEVKEKLLRLPLDSLKAYVNRAKNYEDETENIRVILEAYSSKALETIRSDTEINL